MYIRKAIAGKTEKVSFITDNSLDPDMLHPF